MNRGFTLVEVLVALAIVAIALVAVVKITGQSVRETAKLKEKIGAHWVAMNVISEVQAGLLKTDDISYRDGHEKMLGQVWRWQVDFTRNSLGKIVRMEVKIKPEHQDHVVESLVGAM